MAELAGGLRSSEWSFNNEIYAGIIIVIALTNILPSLVMKWSYLRFGCL